MPHDLPLITTIVAGLVLAFILGAIANRLRMPPLVGYLVAGILVGPYTPGFVADQELASELAELGVILLMFGVGLHFSLRDLLSVRALAVPGAIAQMAVATALGTGLGQLMGWDLGASVVFGIALSVASTVVLLKALQERRLIDTEKGRIAVGWLIVEDLAMVLALVMIPAFAAVAGTDSVGLYDPYVAFVERVLNTDIGVWGVLGLTVIKVVAFVGFMLIVGRRLIPWALHATAHTGSRELFRLAVLAIALGVALGSAELFGVSLALGAFFAGMILSESELSHRAAQETLPLRDAFAVLFFVSVGMLFDPSIVITDPLPLLATVFIIVIGKSIAAFAIVVLFRRPVSTALIISASLAQIGEFSFILASMGVALSLMPPAGQDLILAGALISIILNPVAFFAIELVRPRLEARVQARRIEPGTAAPDPEPVLDATPAADADAEPETVQPTTKSGHIVLVGFGRVGSVVGEGLLADGSPVVVIEDSNSAINAARAMGAEVIVGNAADSRILDQANIAGARQLIIAIPNSFEAGQVTEQSRKRNATLRIIARAHSDEEEEYLGNRGADTVIMGEREIGFGMLAWMRGTHEIVSGTAPAGVLESVAQSGSPSAPAATMPATTPVPAADLVPLTAAAATALGTAASAHETVEPTPSPAAPQMPAEPPTGTPAEPVQSAASSPLAAPPAADGRASPDDAVEDDGLIDTAHEPPVPEELRAATGTHPDAMALIPEPSVSPADAPHHAEADPDVPDLRLEPRLDPDPPAAQGNQAAEPRLDTGLTELPQQPADMANPGEPLVPLDGAPDPDPPEDRDRSEPATAPADPPHVEPEPRG